MKIMILPLLLLLTCTAFGAEREILVCTSPDASGAIRKAAASLSDAKPLAALRKCGAATEVRQTQSAPLLEDRNFKQAAYNNLVIVGFKESDPLLAKCWGHQATVDPGRFYRLGYGTLEGDLGYVECDWNPFLFSNKVRDNAYTTVCIKISGTSEKGVLAAVEAFKKGLLNGVVPAGEVRRAEQTILDLAPSAEAPPKLPELAGFTMAGWTQPDAKEYRAYLDIGGHEPKRLWRVKYLADKVLDDVSAEAWVKGLHRLAYGNAVTIAEFADAAQARSVLAGFAKQRGAKTEGELIVFEQPTDNAFKKSYGKIYYAARGKNLIASSLPEKETKEILKK